jgi:hypothetical protein
VAYLAEVFLCWVNKPRAWHAKPVTEASVGAMIGVVQWNPPTRCYGIVARELTSKAGSSRDRRSPEVIRKAFREFLDVAAQDDVTVAHVQLLGAGKLHAFQPWISLVQMARAYGQWVRDGGDLHVVVYVVDPGVIALLSACHIDLMEQLEDNQLCISVEVIDAIGQPETHHVIVDPAATIGSLELLVARAGPRLYAHPVPTRQFKSVLLSNVREVSFREFGLVTGSTLIVDYRPEPHDR